MKMNNSERLAAAIVSPLLAFVGFVAPCIGANADYCTVTNMCWNGAKTNILAIAESRLAANTNDIVGIVLKLEYDLSFSYLDDFTNNGNWGQTPFLLVAVITDSYNDDHTPYTDDTDVWILPPTSK